MIKIPPRKNSTCEQGIPKFWTRVRVPGVQKPGVIAYCKPGCEHVLNHPWRFPPNKVAKAEKEEAFCNQIIKSHGKVFATTTVVSKHGNNSQRLTDVHATQRWHGVDLESLIKAKNAGISVEEPIAIVRAKNERDMVVFKAIKGTTLNTFLSIEKDPVRKSKVLSKVVDQLSRLHKLGLVHGDAHAGNFMVTPNGKVHIMDIRPTTHSSPHDDFEKVFDDVISADAKRLWPKDEHGRKLGVDVPIKFSVFKKK